MTIQILNNRKDDSVSINSPGSRLKNQCLDGISIPKAHQGREPAFGRGFMLTSRVSSAPACPSRKSVRAPSQEWQTPPRPAETFYWMATG
jgi:hypothetical protein